MTRTEPITKHVEEAFAHADRAFKAADAAFAQADKLFESLPKGEHTKTEGEHTLRFGAASFSERIKLAKKFFGMGFSLIFSGSAFLRFRNKK